MLDVEFEPWLDKASSRSRDIGTERDKRRVTEVEHVHQPEDQRQTACHDKKHHAHRETSDGQGDPGRHAARQRQRQDRHADQKDDRRNVDVPPRSAPGSTDVSIADGVFMLVMSAHRPWPVGAWPALSPEQSSLSASDFTNSPWIQRADSPFIHTATWSPREEAKLELVDQQIVVSLPSSKKASARLWTMIGARPFVGSSINNNFFGSIMARAIATICFCPPESVPAERRQKRFNAGKQPRIESEALPVGSPARRREEEILPERSDHGNAHVLGKYRRRLSGKCRPSRRRDLVAGETDFAPTRGRQPHDRPQSG